MWVTTTVMIVSGLITRGMPAFRMIVSMVVMIVVTAACFMNMFMLLCVIVMGVIMPFAADVLGIHGEQIKECEHAKANSSGEHHGSENAIRRQVGVDALGDVEEKHHTTPEQERGDAKEVDEGAVA